MVPPPAGAVVLVRFPFSDLSQVKLRPAAVLANVGRGDQILCQITSKPYGDSHAVKIDPSAFASGSLHLTSYARPGKLFTANRDLIVGEIARLRPEVLSRIVEAVVNVLRKSAPVGP